MDWEEVKPVLDATYRLLAEEEQISGSQVAEALGRSPDDERTGVILQRLERAGYISARFVMQTAMPILIFPTEKGFQQTSNWPAPGTQGDQVELLLRVIDERLADAGIPDEEKSRLKRARDGIAGAGRDLFVDVLAAYVARQTGASGD